MVNSGWAGNKRLEIGVMGMEVQENNANKAPPPERKPLPLHERQQPPRHIKWQEVIELNPNMPKSDRKTVSAALEEWSHSKIGQADLYEALKAQAKLSKKSPAYLQTEVEEAWQNEFKNNTEFRTIEALKESQGLRAMEVMAQQKKYPKISISTLDAVKHESALFNQITTSGGGGAFAYNGFKQVGLLLHLPTAMATKVSKETKNGPGLVLEPFVAMLAHEMNHAIGRQQEFTAPHISRLSHACSEEHAIAAANSFLQEKRPNEPLRIAYTERSFELTSGTTKKQLEAEIKKETVGDLIKKMRDLEVSVAEDIQLDAGCTPLSANATMAQAKAALAKAGITAEFLEALKPKSSDQVPEEPSFIHRNVQTNTASPSDKAQLQR